MTISEGKDMTLKEFLGDLYDDLMTLTNNDKQRVLTYQNIVLINHDSLKESKNILNTQKVNLNR